MRLFRKDCIQQCVCAIVGLVVICVSKKRSVTWDSDEAGRQNHSLRSFILAPIPTTPHTRTLPAIGSVGQRTNNKIPGH
jgi:hypothetical protein